MEINQITGIIIEESIEIHRDLGPGLMESVYEIILAERLRDRGLKVDCQVEVPLFYQGRRFPLGFRLDMLVAERVVVELKSVEQLPPVAFKKLTTYLRLTEREVGLLINFGEVILKNGLHRIVNKYKGPMPGRTDRS